MGEACCPVQQMVCSHTVMPADLLGRPVNGLLLSVKGDRVQLTSDYRLIIGFYKMITGFVFKMVLTLSQDSHRHAVLCTICDTCLQVAAESSCRFLCRPPCTAIVPSLRCWSVHSSVELRTSVTTGVHSTERCRLC